MSLYRPEFEAALRLLAHISEAMARRGLSRPILVGGAAVEYYSGSAIATGDVDLCSTIQPELETEMQRHGFVKPSGRGKSSRGWIHPDLGLGFQIVGALPLDGNVDRDHVFLIEDVADGESFAIIRSRISSPIAWANMPREQRATGSIRRATCSAFTPG